MSSRAVFLCRTDPLESDLTPVVTAMAAYHGELIVALDDSAETRSCWPLPSRWVALRAQLRSLPNVWVTPLVRTAGLPTREDQIAALASRLGAIDRLWVDDVELVPGSQAVGLPVRHCSELAATATSLHDEPRSPEANTNRRPHEHERALVVLRAQPFHRGHLALVEHALSRVEEVIVVIAAAERAFSAHDPFTAGERLALVRAGLGVLMPRVWLCALPAPTWPAMALPQLAFVAPSYRLVVAHNPLLRALAAQQGKAVEGLPAPLQLDGERLSATRIRARLTREGAGPWLEQVLPSACAALFFSTPSLSERCALIARVPAS